MGMPEGMSPAVAGGVSYLFLNVRTKSRQTP